MKDLSIPAFNTLLHKTARPLSIDFEITDRCPLSCRHCYWQGARQGRDIPLKLAKDILEQAAQAGTLWVALTGGDPMVHPHFEEIYLHAKKLGMVVTVFTGGTTIGPKTIALFRRCAPYCVEITINGSTPKRHDAITGVKDSFRKSVAAVRKLAKNGIPVIIKTNLMSLNSDDVKNVKALAQKLLGKGGRYLPSFKYDPHIHIALSGNKGPVELRVPLAGLLKAVKGDRQMRAEMEVMLSAQGEKERGSRYKYRCAGRSSFTIKPDGFLQYCTFENAFRLDLRRVPFGKAIKEVSASIEKAVLPKGHKCVGCRLRGDCGWCPPRARLEMGKEIPVPFLCNYAADIRSAVRARKAR